MRLSKTPKEKISLSEYSAVHYWLRYNYGPANKCEDKKCTGISKNFNWALKRGMEYERKRENYLQLCRSCHAKYDCTEESIKIMRINSNNARKTHCKRGHPYSGSNLYLHKSGRGRSCRTCMADTARRGYLARKATLLSETISNLSTLTV